MACTSAFSQKIFIFSSLVFLFYFFQNKLQLSNRQSRLMPALQIIVLKIAMHSHAEHDGIISPTAFILDLQSLVPSDLDLNLHESDAPQQSVQKLSVQARTNSRDQKKRLAGLRSREKKKKYVEELEESVKSLTIEVQKYESQISKCKDQLVEAIRSNNNQSNQHAFTYSELQKQALSQDPDLDTINHLLDLIQSRIGANGKQRQTKLDYYFKQITNSLFPAMHRYVMYCAEKKVDLFAENISCELLEGNHQQWTHQLYTKVKFDQKQLTKLHKFQQPFKSKRRQSIECIKQLRMLRDEMKRQQQVFERGISEFRLDLNPVQSALMTVFGQKNKLRREFSIGQEFQSPPQKKVKLEQ